MVLDRAEAPFWPIRHSRHERPRAKTGTGYLHRGDAALPSAARLVASSSRWLQAAERAIATDPVSAQVISLATCRRAGIVSDWEVKPEESQDATQHTAQVVD